MTHHFIRMAPLGLLLMAMIGGCKNQMPAQSDNDAMLTKAQHGDVPVQVVYRIDDHRFVSVENYDRCLGDVYYSDTKKGIHNKIFTHDPTNYRGGLIIDDPTGMNIVFPANDGGCGGDRGCSTLATYSTDGGSTFKWVSYRDNRNNLSKDSEDDTIAVTKDAFYVERKLQYSTRVTKYPLVSGFIYGGDKSLPGDLQIESVPEMPAGLRTPSGQDHFTCDESIRPSNLRQKKP